MSEEPRQYVVSTTSKVQPIERQETDFSMILKSLRDWGFNDYKVAELTGIERSKLSKLRTTARKQPTYDDGCAIMAVYKREKRKGTRA